MSTFDVIAKEFLAQERIAVAGVSRTRQDAANLIYKKLRETGHDTFAINPNASTIEGDPCYQSLQDIPGGVDGVVIITKPEITEQVVQDAVAAGVPRVWMHNNTFMMSSVSDTAVKYCQDNNVQVIAGGCPMMFFDFGHKCMKWMLGVMKRLPAG